MQSEQLLGSLEQQQKQQQQQNEKKFNAELFKSKLCVLYGYE
jgi:hypothetical protein